MDPSTILNSYGLAGLVIFILSGVCVVQYKDNKSLQDKLRDSQQGRVDDAKEVQTKIMVGQEIQGKVMDLIYDKLYTAKKES